MAKSVRFNATANRLLCKENSTSLVVYDLYRPGEKVELKAPGFSSERPDLDTACFAGRSANQDDDLVAAKSDKETDSSSGLGALVLSGVFIDGRSKRRGIISFLSRFALPGLVETLTNINITPGDSSNESSNHDSQSSDDEDEEDSSEDDSIQSQDSLTIFSDDIYVESE